MNKKIISMTVLISMIVSLFVPFGVVSYALGESYPSNARFVTQKGTGTKDGTSWENAFEGDRENGITEAWDKTPENGTLYVEGGEYNFVQPVLLKSGGKSPSEMKKLVGVNKNGQKPTFTGDYEKLATADKGTNFISLSPGIKYVGVENLAVNNYSFIIYTGGKNTGLRFSDIDMKYFCDGFYMDGNATTDEPEGNFDVIIDNCTGYWYRKRMFRFKNGNSNVIVSNCKGDAGGEESFRKGCWPGGIGFENGQYGVWEQNITVVDSVFENSFQKASPETGYWDCDGISGERSTRNLTFVRVTCNSSTDSGFDFKNANQTLIDCIAMDNKRNYKFASDGVVMINCLSAYSKSRGGSGSSTGMWVSGRVRAYNSTFFNNNEAQIQADGGFIDLYNCIVGYYGKESALYKNQQSIIKSNVAEYENKDPQLVNMSDSLFYGDNDSWNSKEYANGEIGYHYNPEKKINVPKDTSKTEGCLDVGEKYAWAKDAIDFMLSNEYTVGYSNAYYAPQVATTRAEFATMLARVLQVEPSRKAVFEDLPKSYEYRLELGALQQLEIIRGDGEGFLRPFEFITREEAMAMVCRAMKTAGKMDADYLEPVAILDKFQDKDMIAKWAIQDIANIVGKGFIQGDTEGNLNPKENITRAETAVLGHRVYNIK